MTTVAALGEKTIIRRLVTPRFCFSAADGEVGIGDDACVLVVPPGSSVVATTDKHPEDFIPLKLGLVSLRDVGRYLMVSSLSDLAAMGAAPLGAMFSICVPSSYSVEDLEDLFAGMEDASREFACPVVGGDTKGGSTVSLVSIAIGHVPSTEALLRSAASPGHAVCVTGEAGRVGTALAYFLAVPRGAQLLSESDEEHLIAAFRRPRPRLAEGQALRASRVCGACQDISDGIGQTAIEIASRSSVRIVLSADALAATGPSCARSVADRLGREVSKILIGPGADYELMFTAPVAAVERLGNDLAALGTRISVIGNVEAGEGVWLNDGGALSAVTQPGFEHLTGRSDLELILGKVAGR